MKMERIATALSLVAATLLLALPLFAVAAAAASTAGVGGGSSINCTRSCGNISFEYPFGVEPGCYHRGFNLTCNHSYHPPRLFLGGDSSVQVLEISIPNATVRVNSTRVLFNPSKNNSERTWAVRDPYVVSTVNSIVLVGCHAQVDLTGGDIHGLVTSCSAVCTTAGDDETPVITSPEPGACSGIGCCQVNIPVSYSSYEIKITERDPEVDDADYSVYIVDQLFNYTTEKIPEAVDRVIYPEALPAMLKWGIYGNGSSCDYAPECRSAHSLCQRLYDSHDSYLCSCSEGYQGNPYVLGGCQDIDECSSRETYPCYGDCINTQGNYSCQCSHGFTGNAYVLDGCKDIDECTNPEAYSCYGGVCINTPGTFHCLCHNGTYGDPFRKGGCVTMINGSSKGLSIGLVAGGGSIALFMALAAPFIIRKVRIHRMKKMRQKFFEQNHGLLLQQLLSQKKHFAERMIITLRKIEKATDNFDKSREIGGGGHGVVYKGILDLHVVAIKKSKIVVQREIDEFINEVAILSQINHRNIVKILGCCLETEVPLLVYEFISNGTLYQHLHVEGPVSLPWDDRLRIALEVARALSYLHSATSMPIFHRDIKSSNILLDDGLTAKVSDFGASRYIPIDQTGITTAVQGTIGYLDPMYYYTSRLTDKSDVFSFGVLLMELLTRKKPTFDRFDNNDSLVPHFVSQLAKGTLVNIIDPQVGNEEGGEVLEVASLAAICTKLKGQERPSMREVEMGLENIVSKKFPSPNRDTASIRRSDEDQISALYMSIDGVTKEASRQYTAEEEMLLSSNYPR